MNGAPTPEAEMPPVVWPQEGRAAAHANPHPGPPAEVILA